jgi:glyoxylase-like metal-dependent hydrolase (beta-lactamase superfamily II)
MMTAPIAGGRIQVTAGKRRRRVRGSAAIGLREIAAGVVRLSVLGSNVYFVRSGAAWVLIDTAWPTCDRRIREAAAGLFGARSAPAAILLSHAHPDHSGSADRLARWWSCPVYVHPDEVSIATPMDLATIERYATRSTAG